MDSKAAAKCPSAPLDGSGAEHRPRSHRGSPGSPTSQRLLQTEVGVGVTKDRARGIQARDRRCSWGRDPPRGRDLPRREGPGPERAEWGVEGGAAQAMGSWVDRTTDSRLRPSLSLPICSRGPRVLLVVPHRKESHPEATWHKSSPQGPA